MVTPAVEGTKKVMAACLEAKIERIVLTASMASICGSQRKFVSCCHFVILLLCCYYGCD